MRWKTWVLLRQSAVLHTVAVPNINSDRPALKNQLVTRGHESNAGWDRSLLPSIQPASHTNQ